MKTYNILSIKDSKEFINNLPIAKEGFVYCAIGLHCWAKNIDPKKAIKDARKIGNKGNYVIHYASETCEVNNDGSFSYKNHEETKLNLAYLKIA